MEKNEWWTVPLGVCIMLVFFTSIGLIAAGGWNWFASFLAGQAANWFQAIGSVAAIFAAYKMGTGQISANRALDVSRHAREDARRLIIIDAILNNLDYFLQSMRNQIEKYRIPVNTLGLPGYILDAIKNVKEIDLFQCPSPKVINLLALIPRQCDQLLQAISVYDESFDSTQDDRELCFNQLSNSLGVLSGTITSTRIYCKEAIQELLNPTDPMGHSQSTANCDG